MSTTDFTIRRAGVADANWMQASVSKVDMRKREGYFHEMCLQQAVGLLALLVAESGDQTYAGHVKVVWESEYPPFRESEIPEIQDLLVPPHYRRRGVATRLLDAAEEIVARRSSVAGLGVGLYAAYGPAQRLYVLRGYVPDGRGAYYSGSPIAGGQVLPFDDEAILYMTKVLRT